jgi:hypothetical protein
MMITYREDHCPHCHVARYGCVNRLTGQALVTLAMDCFDKARCAQEILPAFKVDSNEVPSVQE